MRRAMLAVVLLAGCNKKPDVCDFDLIYGNELEDSPHTIAEVRHHNEKLRKACPGIEYKMKRFDPEKPGEVEVL